MTVAAAAPHTSAVVGALVAASVRVGRGLQPAGSGWQGEEGESDFKGYAVVYPGTGTPDGSVANPTEYLGYICQVTCVGATQDGAEIVADLVKAALADRPLSVAGRSSYRGQILLDRPASRDDTVSPPVHYAVLQFGWTTQAT